MRKRIITLILTAVLLIIANVQVLAISDNKLINAENIAQDLKGLGMFVGTDNGFELDRPANRVEAITMMVRLLGNAVTRKFPTHYGLKVCFASFLSAI